MQASQTLVSESLFLLKAEVSGEGKHKLLELKHQAVKALNKCQATSQKNCKPPNVI